MNMNDLRASAYANGMGKSSGEKKSGETGSSNVVKPFVPPRITKIVSGKNGSVGAELHENLGQNEKKSAEKPVFMGVNKKIGKIFQSQAESGASKNDFSGYSGNRAQYGTEKSFAADSSEYLKSGGLLKVPVAPKEADGSDSVYRRVAKFLLLIGIDEAAKILPHLTAEQTEKIIPEIASIRSVSPEEASGILEEFNGLLEKSRESGGVETAREILEKAYGPDKAREMLEKSAPFGGAKPFDYLNDADSERIFYLLSDETEQIQALVLSKIEPKKAASVINLMKPKEKSEVVCRLAKMEPVSPEILKRVDQAIREKSLAQTTEKAEKIDGRNALAAILKKMSPAAEDEILSGLAEEDPALGEDLRGRLFTMEDVLNADGKFIQQKLREMSDSEIAMLVAAKSKEFQDKILGCISAGRQKNVQDEIEINSPYRKADCERVTSGFFSVLRRAYENGELIIKGRNEEEYV